MQIENIFFVADFSIKVTLWFQKAKIASDPTFSLDPTFRVTKRNKWSEFVKNLFVDSENWRVSRNFLSNVGDLL